MPFTTPILDNFNRANGDAGANWTDLLGALDINSNQGAGNTTQNVSYWNVRTYGANMEAWIEVPTKPADTALMDIGVRIADVGSIATVDGYSARVAPVSGTDVLSLQRITNGAGTTLASVNQEFASGDSLGIRAVGSRIELWWRSGSGLWQLMTTATDSTYTAGGYISLTIVGTTCRVDNFAGGDSNHSLFYPPTNTLLRM